MRHHVKPGRGAASATARDSSASPLLRRSPVEEPAHGDGAAVVGPLVGPGAGLGHSFDRIPIHPEGAPPIQRAGRAGPFSRAPAARSANGTGLAAPLKAGIEYLSGVSLDDVTVHYNSPLPARMQALAYTQGTQIHVGAGQERHVAHEAWHVVQQKQGRVAPTMRLGGRGVNDDASLEREADVMGERVLLQAPMAPASHGPQVSQTPQLPESTQAVGQPVQLKKKKQAKGVTMSLQEFHRMSPEELDARIAAEPKRREQRKTQRALSRQARREKKHFGIPFEKAPDINLDNWAGDHPELAGSHHKFPKRTLGWLHSKMTPQQRLERNRSLFLPTNAGPSALARLRSNLIPWGANQVASDTRQDDPEHTGESLDMVKTKSGRLTPRSRSYSDLAFTYDSIRKRLQASGKHTMSDREASRVTAHMREAEELHHAIEEDSHKPANYGPGFWREDTTTTDARKWSKGRVPASKYAGKTRNPQAYEQDRAEEELRRQEETERRREISQRGYTPVKYLSGMQQLMMGDHWKH